MLLDKARDLIGNLMRYLISIEVKTFQAALCVFFELFEDFLDNLITNFALAQDKMLDRRANAS